jgi:hypothetical protein
MEKLLLDDGRSSDVAHYDPMCLLLHWCEGPFSGESENLTSTNSTSIEPEAATNASAIRLCVHAYRYLSFSG